MDFYHVLTTTSSAEEAAKLGRLVVEQRLAACAQVAGPITSTYWWQGRIETATEWHVWLKTTAIRLDDLIAVIRSNHSYDVPEVIASPITAGNRAYLDWIESESTPGNPASSSP
jgi:periplasmic divalent cation tolerance protein